MMMILAMILHLVGASFTGVLNLRDAVGIRIHEQLGSACALRAEALASPACPGRPGWTLVTWRSGVPMADSTAVAITLLEASQATARP